MNAGLGAFVPPPAASLAGIGALLRVAQLKDGGRLLAALALALDFAFAWSVTGRDGLGRLGRGSTIMSRAMTMINRRTADSADRNLR